MFRLLLFVLLLVTGCTATRPSAPPSYGFVTRLGADTVAVEQISPTRDGFTVELVTRAPRTLVTTASLALDAHRRMTAYSARTVDPTTGAEVRREAIASEGDSLVVRVTTPDGARRTAVGWDTAALPFVEYAHFPFDVALSRGTTGPLPMLTERGALAFVVGRSGAGATLRHPFRGIMTVQTDAAGSLVSLDAGATTRKLSVTRTTAPDAAATARRWAALDLAGQGVGALSGRASVMFTLGEATVEIDHGQPALRGRDVWGGVVPWGQVWRTGADRATHVTTSRPLRLGEGPDALRLAPGAYTLFSVPTPDGGTLIVSRQTGQNGTAYDPAQDLGRVPMALRSLDSPVERLEIVIAGAPGDARLAIRWGTAERWVPLAVEN